MHRFLVAIEAHLGAIGISDNYQDHFELARWLHDRNDKPFSPCPLADTSDINEIALRRIVSSFHARCAFEEAFGTHLNRTVQDFRNFAFPYDLASTGCVHFPVGIEKLKEDIRNSVNRITRKYFPSGEVAPNYQACMEKSLSKRAIKSFTEADLHAAFCGALEWIDLTQYGFMEVETILNKIYVDLLFQYFVLSNESNSLDVQLAKQAICPEPESWNRKFNHLD